MFNSQDMCLKEDCLALSPLEEKASPRQPTDILKVVQAIHHLASLRGGDASSEAYLSAQVNRPKRLQAHKDKNNHSTSWLIALGDFTAGRLWLEDPLGQHPPPCVTSEWQKGLRGSFHNVHNAWFKFDPTKHHALEEVKSGCSHLCGVVLNSILEKDTTSCLD